MTDIVIHIGFPKTASTSLQRRFFPHLADTALVARTSQFGDLYREASLNLMSADDDGYVPDVLAALVRRVGTGADRVLLSDESLCGVMYDWAATWERTARRLHGLFPDARVLVTVRRQQDLLRSLYAFYIQKGGTSSQSAFLAGKASGYPLDFARFEFDTTVERYQQLFGRERVTVLAYESLSGDPQRFLTELAGHIGSAPASVPDQIGRENVSLTGAAMRVLRVANRIAKRSPYNPTPWFGDHAAVTDLRFALQRIETRRRRRKLDGDDEVNRAAERYGPSNARLAALTGLPLGDLGYVLAPERPAIEPPEAKRDRRRQPFTAQATVGQERSRRRAPR